MKRLFQFLFLMQIGGFNVLYIGFLLAFLTTVFMVLGLYNCIFEKRIEIINRLETYTTQSDNFVLSSDVNLKEFILNIIGVVGRKISKQNYMEEKRKKLDQAYILMRVEEFLGISILSAIFCFLLIFYLTKLWYIALIGIIIGFKIPDIYVGIERKKRMKRLNSQLPEALSILSNGLRAGSSFTQAMSIAANELNTPIKDEFLRVIRDNAIGKTLDEALIAFSERTDDEDVDMLITGLIIQRKVGGNLAEILDTISETIRDRMRIRGEVKTLTAQGRLSAIIISVLPFVVAAFMFVINSDYIMELFKSTFGIIMVVGALIMQILGIFIIMKMVNIEI